MQCSCFRCCFSGGNASASSKRNLPLKLTRKTQLSFGLSSEHLLPSKENERFDSEDPERQIYSRFYVNQILDMDEESIRTAWAKAVRRGPTGGHERDARLEQLSWRVWSIKRARAERARTQEGQSPFLDRLASTDDGGIIMLDPSEDILLSTAPSRQPTPPGSPSRHHHHGSSMFSSRRQSSGALVGDQLKGIQEADFQVRTAAAHLHSILTHSQAHNRTPALNANHLHHYTQTGAFPPASLWRPSLRKPLRGPATQPSSL